VDRSLGGPQGEVQVDAETLDKEQIDQLHAATLQVSGNCFELKKLCATVLVAAGTLVASFTDRKLDSSVFVAGLLITVLFWAADSQSYFIQAKMRIRMQKLQERRVSRVASLSGYASNGVGLAAPRVRGRVSAVFRSFANASMLFYFMIAFIIVACWMLFLKGHLA
jgi:hypothetical protein